jgi:ABC-type uncharacterized transport system permease subunit
VVSAIVLMANYPLDLFGRGARLIIYTVVPTAFVSTVPAKLVDHFNVASAALLTGVAVVFAILAQGLISFGATSVRIEFNLDSRVILSAIY